MAKGRRVSYSHLFRQRTETLIFFTGTLHPRHVIQATGHSGEAYFPPGIKGVDEFKGDRLVHSAQFTGPQENGKGKKAVVVGSCNSAHDIAQDYYEHGYDVTMVQRSSTLIVTSESLFSVLMKGLYDETGVSFSFPNPALCALILTLVIIYPAAGRRGRHDQHVFAQPGIKAMAQ